MTDKDKFDLVRRLYPGVKRGLDTEWNNFIRHTKDWKSLIDKDILRPAVCKQTSWRVWLKQRDQFVPQWKHFSTWINQRNWEFEIPEYDAAIARKRTSPAPVQRTEPERQNGPAESVSSILARRKREYDEAMAREHDKVMKGQK